MPAQLTSYPIIKITMTDGNEFFETVPGFICESFKLTKGLLTPNKFEFYIRKEQLNLETHEIEFELRDKLLTAKVEVSLKAKYYDVYEKSWIDYDVEDFFYGYIQNIKLYRTHSESLRFKCVAYSPDARLKMHPACNVYNSIPLKECVEDILSQVIEPMTKYDKEKGVYDQKDTLKADVQPLENTSGDIEGNLLRYTVQYNESHYDFLKRMAKRYAEFMYYENREFVFGRMKELPEVLLHNGTDLEEYRYEMNLNDHTGIMEFDYQPNIDDYNVWGLEKKVVTDAVEFDDYNYEGGINLAHYDNPMSNSAYTKASDYFACNRNTVTDMCSRMYEESVNDGFWLLEQRQYLERYVMSDSMICTGKSNHVDLKLGTQITIEDDTYTGAEIEESVSHRPLVVIGLFYSWQKDDGFNVTNYFKAIPHDAQVPPYLERDKDGFLVYGDFDIYPKSGPQYAFVMQNEDPGFLGRVKVAFAWQLMYAAVNTTATNAEEIDPNLLTPWIRVVSPYQGYHRGSLVVPEIHEKVLVGFENNNMERPYVIGGMYCKEQMPDEWSKYDKNRVKGFRSRSGHCIEFVDNKDTDSGTSKGGRIHIYDAKTHTYDITFDTDQKLIRLRSKGNIELDADNDIVMHAGNDFTINVDHDMAMNVANDMDVYVENNYNKAVDGNVNTLTQGSVEHHSKETYWIRTDDFLELDAKEQIDVEAAHKSKLTIVSDAMALVCNCKAPNGVAELATAEKVIAIQNEGIIARAKQGKIIIASDISDIELSAMNVSVEADGTIQSESKVATTISGKPVKIN